MSDRKEFAQRLRGLRRRAGLTQAKLAEIIGVSTLTVQRWESEERAPRMEEIKKLAATFNISESTLLNGPERKEIRITLHYSEMPKEGEINMDGNEFDLYMSSNGNLGIRGGAKFASLEDIDSFIARAKEQLVEAFTFQQSRGALPATA